MRRLALVALLTLAASPVSLAAQRAEVAEAPGAVLRGLDKVSGALTDIEIEAGATARFGRLQVELGECRYPEADPSSNAYAWLTIRDTGGAGVIFSGWMIAANPALNALDHPRYDIWVLRCSNA